MLFLGCFRALAQEMPVYTQYIFNSYLLNPAVTGIDNYIDTKLGYRNQWKGLEGAPVTQYFSIHAPIGQDFVQGSVNSFGGDGDNPMSRSYVYTYRAAEPHHGIGINGMIDKAGLLKQTKVNLTYAYHIGLSETMNLSLGLSAGLKYFNLDQKAMQVDDESDFLLSSSSTNNRISAELGAGIWLYGARYFLGISGMSLGGRFIPMNDAKRSGADKMQPSFYLTTGYKFFAGEDFGIIPSVLVKYNSAIPTIIDGNLKVAFRDRVWLGGGFRSYDSFSALAGFNVSHLLNLSYSYDFTSSNLNTISNGTHEIVLGILLNNRYRLNCSRYIF